MLNFEVTVPFYNCFEYLVQVVAPTCSKLLVYRQHLMNVELLNKIRVCLTDIINLVTGVTPRCVHSLDAEDCMGSALGRTTHVV